MTVRLRLKRGELELEYEGESDLLAKCLSGWIELLRDGLEDESTAKSPTVKRSNSKIGETIETTTSAIASAIGARTGPDLFKAALGYYQLAQGRERASRSEVLTQMRSASQVYRAAMTANLSKIIRSLLSDRQINEPQPGIYCLTSGALATITQTLPK